MMAKNDLIAFLAQQPLLLLAISAILVSVLGGMLLGVAPWLGRFLRGAGNLGLVAALLLTVAQAARMSSTSDVALTWAGMIGPLWQDDYLRWRITWTFLQATLTCGLALVLGLPVVSAPNNASAVINRPPLLFIPFPAIS